MWTPEETSLSALCRDAADYLKRQGISEAETDAFLLLSEATGISREEFLADREKNISQKQRDAYAALIRQRGMRIPLQYLTGEQDFMGFSFRVNRNVLIPRQDTETVAESALKLIEKDLAADSENRDGVRPYRILDLCTGSGCIGISLLKLSESPDGKRRADKGEESRIEVLATDVSGEALAVAEMNADLLLKGNLRRKIRFLKSDLFEGIPDEKFDLIVSNPPYIPTEVIPALDPEVSREEPRLALDGGADGLSLIEEIIPDGPAHLYAGGHLVLEIGYDQGAAVAGRMAENGFTDVTVGKDLSGNDRTVTGRWPGR